MNSTTGEVPFDAGSVVVVGGGLSGVACAQTLQDAGRAVVLCDRGRRLGGRMAVKTIDGRPVDTGASYFTVADDSFAAVVADWHDRGLARPWTDTFDVVTGDQSGGARCGEPKTGGMRWGAPGGLRTLVQDLAQGLTVVQRTVTAVTPTLSGAYEHDSGPLVDGLPTAGVVLAMPDPQALRLLDPTFTAEIAHLDDSFAPVLALSAGWARREWAYDFNGAFVNDHDVLTWIADDGARRGDGASVLVAHSTPELATANLANPHAALPQMLHALSTIMTIKAPPRWTHVHRWSLGKPAGRRDIDHYLSEHGIGLCGDAWSTKPRVESAYLSGVALARAILSRP